MPKEALEFLEVPGGGAEEGVAGTAGGAFAAIALKPRFAFEVADGGFDRRAALPPSPESLGRRPSAALVGLHRPGAGVIVTARARVDVRFRCWPAFLSDQPAHWDELRLQRGAHRGDCPAG